MSNYGIHAIIEIEAGVTYINETLETPIEVPMPILGFLDIKEQDEESGENITTFVLPTFTNPLTGELITPLSARKYIKFLGIVDTTLYYSKILGSFIDDDDLSLDIN